MRLHCNVQKKVDKCAKNCLYSSMENHAHLVHYRWENSKLFPLPSNKPFFQSNSVEPSTFADVIRAVQAYSKF